MYGGYYTAWAIGTAMVMKYYDSPIQLTISLFLMTSLFSILGVGASSDKLKIHTLIDYKLITVSIFSIFIFHI
jgi:hypothetical protein